MFNIDNIIVPTDFSDYSDVAFKRALDLAEACNAKIHLIHVVADSPDIFKLDRFNVEGQKKIMKDLEKNCKDSFSEQMDKLPQAKKVEIETTVLRGIPSREIIDIQKKINENEAGMGPLGILSPDEIQAIADALAKPGEDD